MDELIELRIYKGRRSEAPYLKWLKSLNDKKTLAIINARLTRIRLGLFGDHKPVGEGVEELRIDFGPGYRVYYGRDGTRAVILLIGGAKLSQSKDIQIAAEYWRDYCRDKDQVV